MRCGFGGGPHLIVFTNAALKCPDLLSKDLESGGEVSSHRHLYSFDDSSHSIKMMASYAGWPWAFFSREASWSRRYSWFSTHSDSTS